MTPASAFGAASQRLSPAGARPDTARPGLRVVPSGKRRPARTPFVVLVLLILGTGLVGLLLLNTGLQQGSFELRNLEQEVQLLRDQHGELTQRVARQRAPSELADRASSLGMVPAKSREFLVIDDGAPTGGTE